MVEIEIKPDTQRPAWTTPSEADSVANYFDLRISSRQHAWRPPTDVFVTEESVIVRVEVAGMRDGDFSITFTDQTLSIRGSRPDYPERRAYHQMEIRFGDFLTEIGLNLPVEIDKIEAEYKDGFLRVNLPLMKPQPIEIMD